MDWQRFLEENNIHFVTRGPNTKRGELSIQCPLCGEDDPSEHLGINLKTGKWGCHRDAGHRGKAPRTLIKAILGCSSQQAGSIVRQYSHSDPDTLEDALAVLEADNNSSVYHDTDVAEKARRQKMGPQFDDFYEIKSRGITRRFFDYLENRNLDDIPRLIKRYDLRCSLTGKYKDRIIIPIRHSDELVGWTSRAIVAPRDAPRYLASSEDVKTTVFNYDELKKGGKRLFIVEGPFDAIKMDNHAHTLLLQETSTMFRATCTFGTSPTISQIAVLRTLVKAFDEAWVLFDQGADGPGAELADWIGARQAFLPDGIDDPGELKRSQLDRCTYSMFDGHFQSIRDPGHMHSFNKCFTSGLTLPVARKLKPKHR